MNGKLPSIPSGILATIVLLVQALLSTAAAFGYALSAEQMSGIVAVTSLVGILAVQVNAGIRTRQRKDGTLDSHIGGT